MSTDVNLPRSHKARFPNACVVCGSPSPSSTTHIVTGSLGWWTVLLWWWMKPFTVKAPACGGCGWKLHSYRMLNLATVALIAWLFMWLVWPSLEHAVPLAARRWVAVGCMLVCCLPLFIYEVFFPQPFDVTPYSESVDYEFRDEQYAIEFGMMNLDADWIKMNGELISLDEEPA